MRREDVLSHLTGGAPTRWDLLVIGGGATGLGCAVDAAARGLKVLLLEGHDFAKGTSSRSTKLVHGGVRYLKQGNISLVLEALHERGLLCRNANHLVHHLAFVVPSYHWWEGPFYGVGLKVYDQLAGRLGLQPSRSLDRDETLRLLPNLEPQDLRGGVIYYDGQFDDARLAVNLAQTIFDHGGQALNYCAVTGLTKENDYVTGATARCAETGAEFTVRARAVINATGVFCDAVRRLDEPSAPTLVAPSQGVHLVVPRAFLAGDAAIMIPQTDDGRVLFAVPWHDCVILGTTDTPVPSPQLEPRALPEEIGFIFNNADRYLARQPQAADVLSVYAGQRPLVRPPGGDSGHTAALSRDHFISVSPSGLLTITGGKWTTYRRMAQDAVDHALLLAGLDHRPCVTEKLTLHGANPDAPDTPVLTPPPAWAVHGTDAPALAALLARELGRDPAWQTAQVQAYTELAKGYVLPG
jgi:glycerol-3-phosphate dehydrogenase